MAAMDNRADGMGKGKRILLFRIIDGASETLMVMRGHTKLRLVNYEMQSYANMGMQRVTQGNTIKSQIYSYVSTSTRSYGCTFQCEIIARLEFNP